MSSTYERAKDRCAQYTCSDTYTCHTTNIRILNVETRLQLAAKFSNLTNYIPNRFQISRGI